MIRLKFVGVKQVQLGKSINKFLINKSLNHTVSLISKQKGLNEAIDEKKPNADNKVKSNLRLSYTEH